MSQKVATTMKKKTSEAPKKKPSVVAKKKTVTRKDSGVKRINLALQGGGSHGAYTWGVLDRILEEEDIEIVAISGTSAGAMNAAVLIDGMAEGGRTRAKEQLAEFWREVSGVSAAFSPLQHNAIENFQQAWGIKPGQAIGAFDALSHSFSPYDLNPLNFNPLRDVLARTINFEQMHKTSKIGLYVTATAVETGQPHVFECKEVSLDVLMASACLPTMFHAVEIDGEPYWDGGYMGNPSIWPLIYRSDCQDVLLVEINPAYRAGTPKNATDIINRLNEISFNSSLISEMRAIHFVQKLLHQGELKSGKYKDIFMHMVNVPEELQKLGAQSKLNVDWEFFQLLRELGYSAASNWIKSHKRFINTKSTVDIESVFLSNKYALSQKKKAS